MKANRQVGSLHGWEDEDYETNQRKLKDLADKLGGKSRQGEAGAKKDEERVPQAMTTVHDRPKRKRSESGGSKSRSESLEKIRKRASSSKKVLLLIV